LIDPASPAITTATPLLHHSTGHDLGQFEKIAWSVPIEFQGRAYLIEDRKFGVGVFAQDAERDEPQARRIVALIRQGVQAATPVFEWMAKTAVQASNINIRNVGQSLFERYVYLRNCFVGASAEAEKNEQEHEVQQNQREFLFSGYSVKAQRDMSRSQLVEAFTYPWVRMSRNASWLALAAIDAFFAWTEHVFIHLAVLQGRITTGAEVAKLVVANWEVKFEYGVDKKSKAGKKHFDNLVTIRRQVRNFVTHGAFGKNSEAFSFHSAVGAVPVVLYQRPDRFSLIPEKAFDDREALATIDDFIAYLWSGEREPARIYIQESDLPLVLPMARDGTYAAAMATVDKMNEFVDHLTRRSDAAANMDWWLMN
jgi:hypothetical protein